MHDNSGQGTYSTCCWDRAVGAGQPCGDPPPYRTTGTPESVQVQVEPLLLPEVDGLMLLRGGGCVVVVVLFRLLARN